LKPAAAQWIWLFQESRGNGAGVMAALRTAGLNLLRLAGFNSIREGLQCRDA